MNNNEEGNSEKKNFRIRLIGPAIIALIPVVAYLMGTSLYQGYLSTFGVDSDIFPISTQYVYINAYYAVTYILLYLLSIIIDLIEQMNWCSLFIILFTTCIIAVSSWYLKRIDIPSKKRLIEKNTTFLLDNELTESIGITWTVFSIFSLLFYCLLFMCIFWRVSLSRGLFFGTKDCRKKA